MKKARKIIANVMLGSIILFTFLAILSIWDVLADDVRWKSMTTMGVICLSSIFSYVVLLIVNHNEKPFLIEKPK